MTVSEQIEHVTITSIGDRVPHARLSDIHSIFGSVLNFCHQGRVVSLVHPKVGAGPFRIVADKVVWGKVESVELLDHALIINDQIHPYGDGQVYHSTFVPNGERVEFEIAAIDYLKQSVIASKLSSPLVQLLTSNACNASDSSFNQELQSQFQRAYLLLLDSDFERGAMGFRGRGHGLTPAGDDFMAGLLLGLAVREHAEKKELSKIRSVIFHNSLGKNLLVNTFLWQSYNGWCDENWKHLILALSDGESRLGGAMQDVLQQGETSGVDMLAGFLVAWEIRI